MGIIKARFDADLSAPNVIKPEYLTVLETIATEPTVTTAAVAKGAAHTPNKP